MTLDRGEIERLEGPLLVVGAGSFVGSSLLRALVAVRQDVVGLCRRSRWRLDDLPKVCIETFDLRESDRVRDLLRRHQPATIFYCVAYGGHPSETNESLIYETQIELLSRFKSLLDEELPKLKAFIHAGTSSEYGFNSAGPSEDDSLVPDSAYSAAKGAASLLLASWGKTCAFPCLNLRLYSVYGEREDPSRLIPQLIYRGIKGETLHLAHPEVSRDFVYIDDVCRAFVRAALSMKPDLYGRSFNVGSSFRTSLADLNRVALRLGFLKEGQSVFGTYEARAWDRTQWYARIDNAKEFLHWEPRISLQEGLERVHRHLSSLDKEFPAYVEALDHASRVQQGSRISLVVACYKDQPSISEIYESFRNEMDSIRQDFEILFVNDASPDASTENILELSRRDRRVRGLVHARSFGSQAAFLSGMESARGDAIILMDGHQQDPPAVAREMVEKWRQGATVVVARRARRHEAEWLQRCRRIFYRILSSLAEFPVDQDVGDFALFERKVRDTILQSNQIFPFLRLHRSYAGFKVQTVHYIRPERKYGSSTNSLMANLRWALLGFVSSGTRPLKWGAMFLAMTTLCFIALPSLWFLPMTGVFVSLMLLLAYVRFAWPRWIKRPTYVRAEYIYDGQRYSS